MTRTSSTKAKTVYGELVNVDTMSDTDQKEPKKVLHRKKHKNSRLGAYSFSCSVYWLPTLWVARFDVVKKTSNHWLQERLCFENGVVYSVMEVMLQESSCTNFI